LGLLESNKYPISLNIRFLWSDRLLRDREISETQFRTEALERAREWLPAEEFAAFDPTLPRAAKQFSCDRLWRCGLLNSDGTVPPCCDVLRPENDFDTYVTGRRFREIWNNDRFRAARRSFKNRAESGIPVICCECPGHDSREKWRNSIRF
jgi:hypothetical protein